LAANTKKLTLENEQLQEKLTKVQENNIFLEEQVHVISQEQKKERSLALRIKQEYL
jgi:hypothetical protein